MKVKILKKVIAILCASVMTTTTIVPAGAVSLTRDLCNNEEKTKVFEIAQNVNDKLEAIESNLKELDNTILSIKSNTFQEDIITEATKSQETITFESLNYWKNAIIKRIADVNNITVGDLKDLEFLSKNLNCFFADLDNFKKNITKKQSLKTNESKKFLTDTLAELYAKMKDFKNNILDLVLKESKTSNEIYDSLLIDETLKFMKKEKDLYDNIRFNYGHIIDKNLELKNQFNVLKKNAETCLNFGEKKSSSEIIKQLNENINDWNKFKERVEEQNEKEKQEQLKKAENEKKLKKEKLNQKKDLKNHIENFKQSCNNFIVSYVLNGNLSDQTFLIQELSEAPKNFKDIIKPYGLQINPILNEAAKFLHDTIKEQNELSIDDIKLKIKTLNSLTKEIEDKTNNNPLHTFKTDISKENKEKENFTVNIGININIKSENLEKDIKIFNTILKSKIFKNLDQKSINQCTVCIGNLNTLLDNLKNCEEQIKNLNDLCDRWKKDVREQSSNLTDSINLTNNYIEKYFINSNSGTTSNFSEFIWCVEDLLKTNNSQALNYKYILKNFNEFIDIIKSKEMQPICISICNSESKIFVIENIVNKILNESLTKNKDFLEVLLDYRRNEYIEKIDTVNNFLNQFDDQLDANLYNNISNIDNNMGTIIDYTKKITALDKVVTAKFKEIFSSEIFKDLK